MSTESQESRKQEHPSTYMVQDRSSQEELQRLRAQDQMLTTAMGGVLPEQADPTLFQRIIDVGCGTGGWLISLAKEYPSAKTLVGVDVSARMVKAARELADEEGVSDRVEFHVMDALRMIEFPRHYFDLVNQRLNFSYLRKWDWPNLLQEYQRVARHNAVIRITEPALFVEASSESLNQLYKLGRDAFLQAGHLFTEGSEGVIGSLPALLHQQGITDVRTRLITTDYTADPGVHTSFIEDNTLIFKTMLPFLRKWTHVPRDYDQIYQQALLDMQQPDFRAVSSMLTVWGRNTQKNDTIPMVEHH